MGMMSHRLLSCGVTRVSLSQWTADTKRAVYITRCTGKDSCMEKKWSKLFLHQSQHKITTLNQTSDMTDSQPPRLNLRVGRSRWRNWGQKTTACISVLSVSTVIHMHLTAEQKQQHTVTNCVYLLYCRGNLKYNSEQLTIQWCSHLKLSTQKWTLS